MSQPLALYIHWPFCKSKCPYCDFNSHVSQSIDFDRWKSAYARTLAHWAEELPDRHITSIFFGGGTPSLMPAELVASILENVRASWSVAPKCEITLEANPTSSEAKKFAGFAAAGVNRLSLGVQSLRAERLKFLGREHSADEALQAFQYAKDNFPRYSLDLIYAQPEQTLQAWEDELGEALQYAGDHLSLYQLTIEENTAFHTKHARGDFEMPEDELAAEFYELTGKLVEARGFRAYEISNYAQPGGESQHNLAYWNYRDYLGIGPGAHSRVVIGGERQAVYMCKAPETWLANVEAHGSGVKSSAPVLAEDAFNEAVLMGMRLEVGISLNSLRELDSGKADMLAQKLEKHWLVTDGFVALSGETVSIVQEKRPLTNRITQHLLLD